MTPLKQSFRRWWQPPRKASDRVDERSVTFLELFYDLVYVVIIAELGHALAEHANPVGVATFAFLFVIVWWAWLNGALYHDLHGNNDIRTRVFTFLQMFAVAAMAVFAHNALGKSAIGFALAYAGFQLILTYLWWRTGVHDPEHRPLARPYVITFLISTLIFVASVFIPAPWRFYLWGLAVLTTILMPLLTSIPGRRNSQAKVQFEEVTTLSHSAVERFGLFTIIVLGEVIVGVVGGVAGHHHLNWTVGVTAGLSMLISIGLWWIYFDFISQRAPKTEAGSTLIWVYLHLFMTMGIAGTGSAALNVIEYAGEQLPADVRWLLVSAIALTLICIVLLMRIIQISDSYERIYRTGGIVTFVSCILVLVLGFFGIPIIPLLSILVLILLIPVFYGIKKWIQTLAAAETKNS